jgi:hypothetical protein
VIEKQGYLTRRLYDGLPMARVAAGWCIFFNQGCILHKLGAEDGDKHRYKPAACSLFPLARDEHDRWYVRQFGYKDETWSLFCLDPKASSMPASESMRDEVALAQHYDAEEKAAQRTDGSTS